MRVISACVGFIEKITELTLELLLVESKATAVEGKRNTTRSVEIEENLVAFRVQILANAMRMRKKLSTNFFYPLINK